MTSVVVTMTARVSGLVRCVETKTVSHIQFATLLRKLLLTQITPSTTTTYENRFGGR